VDGESADDGLVEGGVVGGGPAVRGSAAYELVEAGRADRGPATGAVVVEGRGTGAVVVDGEGVDADLVDGEGVDADLVDGGPEGGGVVDALMG
ncbi:hypothetical protein JYK22_09330, partial [Nonomuraea sp. RK-328]|nr:hypothetical protein [Nonomuraea sp. RK-328]